MQRKSPLIKKKQKERNWNDNQKGESISPVVVLIFRSSFSSHLDEELQRFFAFLPRTEVTHFIQFRCTNRN